MNIKDKIHSFSELKNGWDSYKAPAITNEAMGTAFGFVDFLQAEPVTDGGIKLFYFKGDLEIELYIGPDGKFTGFSFENIG